MIELWKAAGASIRVSQQLFVLKPFTSSTQNSMAVNSCIILY